jgi:hypothetical protein
MDVGFVGGDEAEERQFLAFIDQESGLLAAAPLLRRTAEEIVSALHAHWVRPFGPPARLTTDGAPEFMSMELRTYAERHGVQLVTTSPYNPPANIAECAVKKIKSGLRKAMHEASYNSGASRLPWTSLLDSTVHAWNSTVSEATGVAPAVLFFGREIRHPSDAIVNRPLPIAGTNVPSASIEGLRSTEWLRDRARDRRTLQAERRATFFDRQAQCLIFPVDMLVTVYRQRTGIAGVDYLRRSGPYRVARRLSETTYLLAHLDGTPLDRPTHVRWMTPYHLAPDGLRKRARQPNEGQGSSSLAGRCCAGLMAGTQGTMKRLVVDCSAESSNSCRVRHVYAWS